MLMAPKKSGKKKAGQFTTSKMGVAPVKRGREMEEIQFEESFCLLRSFSLGLIRHCLFQSLCGAIFPTKHFWAGSSSIPKRIEHAGIVVGTSITRNEVFTSILEYKSQREIYKEEKDQSITRTTRTVKQILLRISPWIDWRSDGALAQITTWRDGVVGKQNMKHDQIAPKYHRWHLSWRGRYHSRRWQVARALGDKLRFLVTTCCRNFWSLTERD